MAKSHIVAVCQGIALVQRHLHSRNDRTWYVRIKHKQIRDGRLHWTKVGPDLDRALLIAKQVEGAIKAGANRRVAKGSPRVSEVLWAWLNEYGQQLSRGSRQDASVNIRHHLEPAFGDLSVTLLTKARLWEYAAAKNEAGLSTGLIRNTLSTLRTACNVLWEGELEKYTDWMPPQTPAGRNPSKRISATIRKAEAEFRAGKREPFTRREAELLLGLAADHFPRLHPMLRLAFGTGMRVGEILGLRWDAVDLDRGVIEVREQITARGHHGRPKTREDRFAVLPAGVLDMLSRLRSISRPSAVWVFETPAFTPVQYRTVREWFKRLSDLAFERHGIPKGRTFHSTRHTFATEAMMAGVPDKWRERQAGHSGQAAEKYLHISEANRPDLSFADFSVTLGNTANPKVH